MPLAAQIVVGLIAILHVCILVLEMFLWTTPRGRKAFGLTAEFAEATKVLAANQGLYNGFLAAGLLRRQKVFRLIKESDESDGEVRITLYTDRIGNRLIEVPDPQFTYAEMDKARTLLIERLQVLEQAAAPPTASPVPRRAAARSPTPCTSS